MGITFAINGFSYVSLLGSGDKTLISYINGTAGYTSVFLSRITNLLMCTGLIFVFNLIKQTAFLNYIFLGYQMCLVTLSVAAVMTLYSISGIVNAILFIFPINILNICLLSFFACICMQRAAEVKKYNLKFGEGFSNRRFWIEFSLSLLALFVLCLICSFIFPLLIKSFVIVSY